MNKVFIVIVLLFCFNKENTNNA